MSRPNWTHNQGSFWYLVLYIITLAVHLLRYTILPAAAYMPAQSRTELRALKNHIRPAMMSLRFAKLEQRAIY